MHVKLDTNDKIIAHLKANTSYVGDCWLYLAGVKNKLGHRRITVKGKLIGVHRLAANIYLGMTLDDWKIQANHKSICSNTNCWNPDHLYIGTQVDNVQDSIKAGNNKELRKTHCPKGHEYTAYNTIERYDHRSRQCRECTRVYQKQYKLKKKLEQSSNAQN